MSGKALLDASGRRLLDSNGDQYLANASDECAECCGGGCPASLDLTAASTSICTETCRVIPLSGTSELRSDTISLNGDYSVPYVSGPEDACRYELVVTNVFRYRIYTGSSCGGSPTTDVNASMKWVIIYDSTTSKIIRIQHTRTLTTSSSTMYDTGVISLDLGSTTSYRASCTQFGGDQGADVWVNGTVEVNLP